MTTSKYKKDANAVIEDRNWTALIKNEEICANLWEKDWGFLAGNADLNKADATKLYTVDDRIKAVQKELEKLDSVPIWNTTTSLYGSRSKVELYEDRSHNIHKNSDLMPNSRKLPKGYKKKKWTAPADEFDPLKKFNKK